MDESYLNYGKLVDDAMHSVVRETLRIVIDKGLPPEHHFFITFETQYAGVMISDELKKKYPEEMTIVVQHQYWDLEVEDARFSIVLSFDNVKQSLVIPFNALISFADPSVKFGLQFHHDIPSDKEELANNTETEDKDEPVTDGSNIITLDSFRKK